jgi:hypothetical protein
MKKLFRFLASCLMGASALLATPAPLFLNEGLITEPTVIDATVFVNTGTFLVGEEVFFFGNVLEPGFIFLSTGANNPVVAYETQNTLVYTNRGFISAIPGINFEYVDDAGNRGMASQFYNGPGATVSAEFGNFTADIGIFPNQFQPLYGGFLSIYATNIINRGTLRAFYSGDIQIHGVNVDLGSSRVGEEPLLFSSFRTDRYRPNTAEYTRSPLVGLTETDFYPETDVVDRWWRYSETGINLESLATIDDEGIVTVQTPLFRIYTRFTTTVDDTGGPFAALSLDNAQAFVFKGESLDPASATNQQFEVVFVDNSDPSVAVDVSWQPGPDPVNLPAMTAYIRFTSIQPDLINQGPGSTANQFIIVDNYGSEPNEVLLLNNATLDSQKPTNLFAFRGFPEAFIPGVPIGGVATNSPFYADMFTKWFDASFPDGVTMSNRISTNRYATWSAELERYPSSFVGVSGPGGSLTNLAGRIMISGDNLNLRNARIQGQSLVSIQTDNLVSSRGAVIDAPILNLDLGAKDGNLVVQDLAKGSPSRFGGGFAIWSTTFTNFWSVSGTNEATDGGTTGTPIDIDDDGVPDGCDTDGDGVIDVPGDCPTDPGAGGEVVTTNYNAIYHVTVIRNSLSSGVGLFLNDLRVRGTNVDLRDQLSISQAFSANAENLTVSGSLQLFRQRDLVSSNLAGLQTLTNLGFISVPGFIGIGLSPSPALKVIANQGTIRSTGINLSADRFENSGVIQADGANVQINATDYVNNGGSVSALFDVNLNTVNANLAGAQIAAGGFVNIHATGDLSDGGVDFPGLIAAPYGINLPVKPATGNLLGTTVSLVAPQFSFSESFWAAEDLGPTQSGYQNNAALGVLSLDIDVGGVLSFSPVGSANAIYVERLELSDLVLADLENALILSEGMTLYYASTSDNVNPADLDGFVTSGGGTLRWVKDGSGTGSAELVTIRSGDGRTLRVPKALRFSQVLDSDGDGVVNASDSSPFDLVVVSQVELVKSEPPFFRVVWMAAAGQTYEVQGTSDLKSGGWSAVKQIRNTSNTVQRMVLEDPVDPASQAKSYRVIVNP